MTHHLQKCPHCHKYTLDHKCPQCKLPTENVHPPKFSLQDKYQKYRLSYFREKMKIKIQNL
ncbi:MAG: nucleolar RNA-binding Nop10p family protein [Promethearchaeota archaeon]